MKNDFFKNHFSSLCPSLSLLMFLSLKVFCYAGKPVRYMMSFVPNSHPLVTAFSPYPLPFKFTFASPSQPSCLTAFGMTFIPSVFLVISFLYPDCCCCCCYVALVVSNSVRPHRRQPTRLPVLGFSRQEQWNGLPFPSPMHESET